MKPGDVPEAIFNDIYLENRDYTVVYTDYKQKNIYNVSVSNGSTGTTIEEFYRYNSGEIPYLLDISDIKDKITKILHPFAQFSPHINTWGAAK